RPARRGAAAGRVRRGPVQLVRAAVAATLLARDRGGRRAFPDAVDLPAHAGAAAGAVHPVRGGGGGAAGGRRSVARLLAPSTRFVAEARWQGLVVPVDRRPPDSVHLADGPVRAGVADDGL